MCSLSWWRISSSAWSWVNWSMKTGAKGPRGWIFAMKPPIAVDAVLFCFEIHGGGRRRKKGDGVSEWVSERKGLARTNICEGWGRSGILYKKLTCERQNRHFKPKGEADEGPGTRAHPEKMTPLSKPGCSWSNSCAIWKATMEPMEWPVCRKGQEQDTHEPLCLICPFWEGKGRDALMTPYIDRVRERSTCLPRRKKGKSG